MNKYQTLKQKIFLLFALLIACFSRLHAQTGLGNLEFIENKGQWDNAVRFRADMPNTIFFLQKHGFSVLLQSPRDMEALRDAMHGITTGGKPSGKKDASSNPVNLGT